MSLERDRGQVEGRRASPAAALDRELTVTEIYKSVQGESTWAGLPCIFVRLTGCPLRCVWCDTAHAFTGGARMTLREIVARCDELGGSLVEITGGEPLAQKPCPDLASALLTRGYTVLCETSGALRIDRLPRDVCVIMDLKCPGSGESNRNDWSNIETLKANDEVKFVIADRGDYEWSREVTAKYNLRRRCREVLFSPVSGALDPRELVRWILEDGLDVRFQLQLHKYVWPPDTKGV